MTPNLGLVCITDGAQVRYRALTRTRLLALDPPARQARLHELYADNLARFRGAVDFCHTHNIRLYRVTSQLFPFADEPEGRDVLLAMAPALAEAGRHAAATGLRVVAHPDQFVVLNSDQPHVIANSIKILTLHALVFDLLGLPRSAWATILLHGGKGGRAERLVETVGTLDAAIRARLAFENDERAYGAAEILDICRLARVPMVFDAHHHLVREHLGGYDDPSVAAFTAAAAGTWPDAAWQIVHISNGREHPNDPRHSDFITAMPGAFRAAPWIEVEAKRKELAVFALRRDWPGCA